VSAELAARRTAAAAVLADFRREAWDFIEDDTFSAPQPDYTAWAFRLAEELASVLCRLDDEGKPVSQDAAEAITEARALRALVAEILSRFGPSGSGHTARVGQVQITRWRTRAGLEG